VAVAAALSKSSFKRRVEEVEASKAFVPLINFAPPLHTTHNDATFANGNLSELIPVENMILPL
jgi:hypothetical protein